MITYGIFGVTREWYSNQKISVTMFQFGCFSFKLLGEKVEFGKTL